MREFLGVETLVRFSSGYLLESKGMGTRLFFSGESDWYYFRTNELEYRDKIRLAFTSIEKSLYIS